MLPPATSKSVGYHLTVTIISCSPAHSGYVQYVYKLSDIVGHVEVSL